jgi:hypothetical protein
MRLNAPTKRVCLLSVVLAGVAVASQFIRIQYVSGSGYAFWILTAAFVLLFLGTVLKKL